MSQASAVSIPLEPEGRWECCERLAADADMRNAFGDAGADLVARTVRELAKNSFGHAGTTEPAVVDINLDRRVVVIRLNGQPFDTCGHPGRPRRGGITTTRLLLNKAGAEWQWREVTGGNEITLTFPRKHTYDGEPDGI